MIVIMTPVTVGRFMACIWFCRVCFVGDAKSAPPPAPGAFLVVFVCCTVVIRNDHDVTDCIWRYEVNEFDRAWRDQRNE